MARALALKRNTGLDERENAKWQTLQVSILSIANCIGRILIGIFLHKYYLTRLRLSAAGVTADFAKHRGMRRTQCLVIVAVSLLVSQLVGLRVRDIEQLQYAVMLVGISFGGIFGLIPTIVIEWFGMGLCSPLFLLKPQELTNSPESLPQSLPYGCTAHFSENWGFVAVSPLLAGNVFSMIFGRIFDAHSFPSEHGMRCLEGARCYSASFYVTTLACFCALVLALVAAKRDQMYR